MSRNFFIQREKRVKTREGAKCRERWGKWAEIRAMEVEAGDLFPTPQWKWRQPLVGLPGPTLTWAHFCLSEGSFLEQILQYRSLMFHSFSVFMQYHVIINPVWRKATCYIFRCWSLVKRNQLRDFHLEILIETEEVNDSVQRKVEG